MVKHKHADVGVAVSIPGGLITPIMRRPKKRPLSVISNEMKDLGKRAKDRKLQPQEYQGGTTAVSNMGMMGVKDFAAVVNPPHATILAVGAGEQRPVVKNGALAVATVMTVTFRPTIVRRWRAGRGTACSVQGLHRKSDGDAGLIRERWS
jgi:pyruvate dehydrogenase E2 component (dihydrolipoamide acetyltransferase)